MSYVVHIKTGARKQLAMLPRAIQVRVDGRIRELAKDPRPHASVKLEGEDNLFRVRVGDYRIVYEVHDDVLIVLVIRIGHRRDVYR